MKKLNSVFHKILHHQSHIMSQFKVEVVNSHEPGLIFADGSYMYNDDNGLYYCDFRKNIRILKQKYTPHDTWVKKLGKNVYLTVGSKICECDTESGRVEEYPGAFNKIVEINNVVHFCGKDIILRKDAGPFNFHGGEIIYSDSEYVISAALGKVNPNAANNFLVEMGVCVYRIINFEKLYSKQFDANAEKYATFLPNNGREVKMENINVKELASKYIFVHGNKEIKDGALIQVCGEIFRIKKKKEKASCVVCKEKIYAEALVLPCTHRGFCYACVVNEKNCTTCSGSIDKIIKL